MAKSQKKIQQGTVHIGSLDVVKIVADLINEKINNPKDPLAKRLAEIESTKNLTAKDYAIYVT